MKEIPSEWRTAAETLIRKHEERGWKDVSIGLPDYSNAASPSLFAYGTPPNGDRLNCIVTQDASGLDAIDRFFNSK